MSDLDFAGRTKTTAESVVRKDGLFKTIRTHQDGERQQSRGCMRAPMYQQQTPLTRTDRYNKVAELDVREGD